MSPRDEDTELIKLCLAGEDKAFAELVEKYQRMVFNIIYHLTGSRSEVEDIAQKVFTKVYFSLSRFRLGQPFAPWLYRITINQCYDELRQRRRRRLILFSEMEQQESNWLENTPGGIHPEPGEVLERAELKAVVRRLLDLLPRHYKAAIVLHDIEGLSYEEVAAIFGCSTRAARLRVFRARMRLKRLFAESAALKRLLDKVK